MRLGFANYIAAPFVFAALGVLYYAWEHVGDGAIWMVPCILIAAFVWVLTPQINWWWYSKRPPTLETGVVQALERFNVFYQQLDAADKQRFRERLALTRMATDWTSKDMPDDEIPPDLETAIATQSVMITWNKPTFLFPAFEKVVVAPAAFLSPEHPFPHHSETYPPEQCLLFSAKSVIASFAQPALYFNIALYEYAKIFLLQYTLPALSNDVLNWDLLEQIEGGWKREQIETEIGIAGIEPLPVALCYFHTHKSELVRVMPTVAAAFENL